MGKKEDSQAHARVSTLDSAKTFVMLAKLGVPTPILGTNQNYLVLHVY